MADIGQINAFDELLSDDETFVIIVQAVINKKDNLIKDVLREYPSLKKDEMTSLLVHLKDFYLNEPLSDTIQAFTITVYTNQSYAGDNIYANLKRTRKNSKEWTHTAK
jgi:hypothetical protein